MHGEGKTTCKHCKRVLEVLGAYLHTEQPYRPYRPSGKVRRDRANWTCQPQTAKANP